MEADNLPVLATTIATINHAIPKRFSSIFTHT